MLAMALEKPVRRDKEDNIRMFVGKAGKGRIDLAAGAGVEDPPLQPQGAGSVPNAPQCFVCARTVGRIDENPHARAFGRQRM